MPNGNAAVIRLLNSSIGRRVGRGTTITLAYVGPKSGKSIELPVWAAHRGDRWYVGIGWADKKKWFHAFRRPLDATITRKGTSYAVVGHLASEDELGQAREEYLAGVTAARRTFKGTEPIVIFEPR